MLPATLTKSVMSLMVISARQLLAANATLLAWSGGKVHRARELAPVNVGGTPCVGNHIVVAPGTLFGAPNPNAESEALFALAFGVAFSEPYRSLGDGEDSPADVVELIQKQLGTDPTFQTTYEAAGGSGALADPGLVSYPLIDAEARFADPASPDGFLSFEAVYQTRINFLTRALTF